MTNGSTTPCWRNLPPRKRPVPVIDRDGGRLLVASDSTGTPRKVFSLSTKCNSRWVGCRFRLLGLLSADGVGQLLYDWHDNVAAFGLIENSMVAGARYANFRRRRALCRAA
jgi:predicted metal-binding membrane protein